MASGRVLGVVVAAALISEPPTMAITSEETLGEAAAENNDQEEMDETTEDATSATTASATTSETTPQAIRSANLPPSDTTPPIIAITWPKSDVTVDNRTIEFRGTTEPGSTVRSGNYKAKVDEDGNWRIRLALLKGRNRAHFTAMDTNGNEAIASISVTYEPPQTTTTKKPRPTTTKPPVPDTVQGGKRNVEEWRSLVAQYFPPELVDDALVVMKCESKGNPLAYNSRSGASGLFQFIRRTWNWASSKAGWAGATPFDPEANVASAAWLTSYSSNRGTNPWYHWSCNPSKGRRFSD